MAVIKRKKTPIDSPPEKCKPTGLQKTLSGPVAQTFPGGEEVGSNRRIWRLEESGFTFSLLDTFMSCPQKHRLRTEEGLASPRGSTALHFGSLFHECHDYLYKASMEKGFKTESLPQTITRILKEIYAKDQKKMAAAFADTVALEDYEMNFGQVEIVLRAYAEQWKADFTSFKFLGLEELFDHQYVLHLPEMYWKECGKSVTLRLRGKRDGRFQSGKRMWLLETKTKAQIEDSVIIDKMAWDLQVMIYLLVMWQEFGQAPGGVLYNLVRRPMLRQGKAESMPKFLERIREDIDKRPEHYFMRLNASITAQEIKEWEPTLQGMVLQLWRHGRGEFHFKNSSNCNGRFGKCEFLPVCSANDRHFFIQKKTAFPELEEEAPKED